MAPMGDPRKDRWEGGYIRYDGRGRPTYIIEREMDGRRFHVSTRTHTARAALAHLSRFEADPANYRPGGAAPAGGDPVYLTADLSKEFLEWSLAKGNTRLWVNSQRNRLAHWIEDIGNVDLRKVTLRDHIAPALDRRKSCRPHRIAVLKAFFGWLRKVKHEITSSEDPTLDLPVPQARPEKWKRRKAVEWERVQAAAEHLAPPYRDVLAVLAATGWHTTELARFVHDRDSEIIPVKGSDVVAVLVTRHKLGERFKTSLTDLAVLAAAKRLRERGTIPKRPNEALKAACRAAEVAPFTFGVMRHSVATWAAERGAHPAAVSQFLHHKDRRTTERFYTDVAVPPAVPLPALRVVGQREQK
jgi:integrase